MTQSAPNRWRQRAPFLLLLVLTVLPYLNSLRNEFTIDDVPIIVENPLVHSLQQTPRIFTSAYWPSADADKLYRPLVIWSYALNWTVSQSPATFRAVNLALYAACVLLIFALVRRLFANDKLAFITAALFATHPIHVEAVASIVGRAELFMAIFTLGSLLCYAEARQTITSAGSSKHLAFSLLLFLLALLCKENAIALVALVPLLDATRALRDQKSLKSITANWRLYVAFLAVAAIYLCIRIAVLGTAISAQDASDKSGSYALLAGAPLATRLAIALRALGGYFELLVWPMRLSAHHEISNVASLATLDVLWPASIAVALLGWMMWSARKPFPLPFFAIGFGALLFLPVSNVLIPIGTLFAERVVFLPSLGFALLLGAALQRARKAAMMTGFCLLTLSWSTLTWTRNADWRDNLSIWQSAHRLYPQSFHILDNLALAHFEKGDAASAELYWQRALALHPDHWSLHLNLGGLMMAQERYTEADTHYAKAAALNPESPTPSFNRGLVAVRQGNLDDAIAHYRRALELDSNSAPTYNALGAALARQKKFDAAEAAFRCALTLDPANEIARKNLEMLQRARATP